MQSPMNLSIDISDKTAVAAAIPLLQLLLGYAFTAAADGGTVQVQPNAAAAFSTPAALPLGVTPAMNAAAAFAPQAGAAPLGLAPLGAGATVHPIVPGGLPGSFQPPPGNTGFVPPGAAAGAPSGAAVQQAAPANNVELDSKGLPWDDRIHAGTKTKTVPGAWKAKKGVDAATVASVEAELRARVAAGGQAPVTANAAQQAAAGGLPPLGAGPFVPPGAALPSVQTAAPSGPVIPVTFEDFMPRITAACVAGILPMEAVNNAVAAYQLPSITALQQNLTYVPHVWQYLQQQYPALV